MQRCFASLVTIQYQKNMKESFISALLQIWQDKRTLWSRLWLPFLLFSALLFIASLSLGEMGGDSNFGNENSDSGTSSTPQFTVGIVANENGDSLIQQLKIIESIDYQMIESIDSVQKMMDDGTLDLAIVIDAAFDDAIKRGYSGEIILYSGYDDGLKEGVKNNIDWYERLLLNQRLSASGFNDDYVNPVNLSEIEASNFTGYSDNDDTESEADSGSAFTEIGGIIFMLIFYFAWLGGIYPALSLFTGDVVSQIVTDKPEIVLIGRTLAVTLFGLLHSLLLYLVMVLIFQPYQGDSNLYLGMIKVALRADLMPLLLLNLLPLTLIFATFLTWTTLRNNTFKESQNRIQPLKLTIATLLVIGITAGFGTSILMYFIPVLNIGLLSRLFLQDNLNWLYMALTYIASFGVAYLCFQEALKIFKKQIQPPVWKNF